MSALRLQVKLPQQVRLQEGLALLHHTPSGITLQVAPTLP